MNSRTVLIIAATLTLITLLIPFGAKSGLFSDTTLTGFDVIDAAKHRGAGSGIIKLAMLFAMAYCASILTIISVVAHWPIGLVRAAGTSAGLLNLLCMLSSMLSLELKLAGLISILAAVCVLITAWIIPRTDQLYTAGTCSTSTNVESRSE